MLRRLVDNLNAPNYSLERLTEFGNSTASDRRMIGQDGSLRSA